MIIYRNDGPWGAGKGSLLTASEVDFNFFDLVERVAGLEESGIQPNEIYMIDVVDNAMVITMEDLTTFGPFPLPIAAFRWTDEYTPLFDYEVYDLFTAEDGMYMVRVAHTAATEFDPGESNTEGDFYQLIFPYPTTLDVGFFFPGAPGYGIAVDEAMFTYLSTRDFYFEATLPLSLAVLRYDTTDELVFSICKNDTEIGTVTFAAAAFEGTFDFADPVQFNAGDLLRVIRAPGDSELDLDATARDLAVTFRATKGTL